MAINTKITALEVFPFIILAIFIRQPFNQNIELKKLFNKKNFSKSLLLSLLFIGIFFAALFSTFPFYYPDPISQLTLQFNVLQEYGAITEPSTHIKKIFLPFVASATIAPIIDGYYHIFEPDNIPDSTKSGHTFSSIPLALFFMIGIVYILFAIKRKKLSYAEFLILFWYASIYLILTASIESYNTSRHFIPLVFPMIVIASYAIWKFLVPLKNKIKIPFFGLSIFSHAVTFLIFWKEIYFEPSVVWTLPVIFEYNQWCALSGECMRQAINMKESLNNPVVLFSGIVFLVIVLIIYINKNKKLTTDKLKKI